MKVVIVGSGKIGVTLTSRLVGEGHDVVVVDNSGKVIEDITNLYDVMGVAGNGVDCDVLNEAGAGQAELVAAVTDSDEKNMLCCYLARKLGAKHTISRIRNPEYFGADLAFLREHLGLSMVINPELLAAEEIFNLLKFPAAVKVEYFSRRNFEMVEVVLKPDSPLDGMKLSDMRTRFKGQYLICAVQRGEEVIIPDGRFELKAGDRVGITGAKGETAKLLKNFGLLQKQAKSVMILGGSRTAFYLTRLLLASGTQVKIIERDRDICRDLCDAFPKAMVLQGDGASQEILMEEGLTEQDAFVALTGMDEENALMSIFAANHDVPKVIAKLNRDEMIQLAGQLGLDTVVSPKRTVSDLVAGYARALHNSIGSNIETLYNLMDGGAEALEFSVSEGTEVLDTPLKEMKFRPNTLIAGIIRNRKAFVPSGDDMILANDKVVVICSGSRYTDISEILA